MNSNVPGSHSLSATLLEHVDALCDRFEHEWREGERPRIEAYLAEETEPTRSVLFHEILLAELEWRRRLGESPEKAEYAERFAERASQVDAIFAGGPTTGVWANSNACLSVEDVNQPDDPSCRFQILKPLAEGGLGVVSIARDAELRRKVALKEIQPRLASKAESRARFLREAEITGSLEHPGIVPVYSLGRHPDGRPYYAMRLVEGISLKDAIIDFHGNGPGEDPGVRTLALRKLLDRFRDVCETLAYAHSRGVVHRDVKPQNIMVGRFGETLLVDWGLAKATGQSDADHTSDASPLESVNHDGSDQTAAGSALGTPAYMSPEQADGSIGRLSPLSDVYGLGATLYQILTGRPPFEGNLRDVVGRVKRGDFPRPRSVRRDIPRPLEAICLKAMALAPDDRYPSASALAADIENWLADEPVSAWREPFSIRALRWIKRHRTPVIAIASAVFLTAVVFGGCVLLYCLEHMHMTWHAG
jgi:serine/threonine-protein kinase